MIFYVDGSAVKSIDPDLVDRLKAIDEKAVVSTNVSFVGFVSFRGEFHVFLPKGSVLPTTIEEKKTIARCLFRALVRFQRSGFGRFSDERVLDSNQISNFFNLIDFWKRFGEIKFSNKVTVRNRGRVNWNKTIVKEDCAVGRPGAYLNFQGVVSHSKINEIVGAIQRKYTALADKEIGWLYSRSGLFHGLQTEISSNINLSYALFELKKALRLEFTTDRQLLLQSLIHILEAEETQVKNGDFYIFGLSHFWSMWEASIRSFFPDERRIFRMPYPVFLSIDGQPIEIAEYSQRPDIMFKFDNCIYVIDAKYYNMINSLPGWQDIVKQLYYVDSLKAQFPKVDFKNFFILPLGGAEGAPHEIRVRAFEAGHYLERYSPIKLIQVDPFRVLERYGNYGEDADFVSTLMT